MSKKRYFLVSEQFLSDVKEKQLDRTAWALIDRIHSEAPLVELNAKKESHLSDWNKQTKQIK